MKKINKRIELKPENLKGQNFIKKLDEVKIKQIKGGWPHPGIKWL